MLKSMIGEKVVFRGTEFEDRVGGTLISVNRDGAAVIRTRDGKTVKRFDHKRMVLAKGR